MCSAMAVGAPHTAFHEKPVIAPLSRLRTQLGEASDEQARGRVRPSELDENKQGQRHRCADQQRRGEADGVAAGNSQRDACQDNPATATKELLAVAVVLGTRQLHSPIVGVPAALILGLARFRNGPKTACAGAP
jgi:hypothetical protein